MSLDDKDFYESLGARIKLLRLATGASENDLAHACRIDLAQYATAETAGTGLTFSQLHDIVHSLGTTVDAITDGLVDEADGPAA
jgi:transcriptional regulator with XRE-family HTH domain